MEDHKPHARRLRIGRQSTPNHAYLITTVTHGRTPLFNDHHLARLLIKTLRHQHESGVVESLAFVVMPDHLHWLIQLTSEYELSVVIAFTKRMTARHINSHLNQPGSPVWQRGFHDHCVREDEDLRDMAKYIVANPLRAGIVTDIRDYPWWDAAWL
ncbi:MAG: transposase [Sedimenticola sp.]